MAHFEKDEVPMLSETHAQLSDEVVDSSFRRLVSRTRSASISIPMASLESYEKETSLVGHTGPLRSVRKTPSVQMSGPLYATNGTGNLSRKNIVVTRTKVVESKTEKFSTFNGTDENRWDNDYNRKNEHLMRSGQLGMCNDPYCTTCPTYFKASQPRTRRTSAIFDPKFRLAYVSPESRVVGAGDLVDHPKKIALNYLKGYFFIDLFVVLPLPQIMISFVLRKYLGISGANFAKNLLRATILLQYFPRLFRFLPLLIGQSPTGFIFESAWANFIINLLFFILSGHVVGSGWNLFGLQACQHSNITGCSTFIDCGSDRASDQSELWNKNVNATACLDSSSDQHEAAEGVLLDDDLNEPTMGEKLASLSVLDGNKSRSDIEQESSVLAKPPSADSVHVLLKQALNVDDRTLLLDCLFTQNEKFMMVNGTKVYDLGNGLEIAHNLTRVFDTQFTLNYDNDQVEKGMDMELSQPPSHEIVPLVGRHMGMTQAPT
ncbi:hypothetical protein JHK87_055917 [Glycine soja]|nr:hypothetical protein JHK87_055917 [Glycine soja]